MNSKHLTRVAYRCLRVQKRCSSSLIDGQSHPHEFTITPDFFSLQEQRILLAGALRRLELSEKGRRSTRRKKLNSSPVDINGGIQAAFLPEDCYQFEEVTFYPKRLSRKAIFCFSEILGTL